MSRDSLAPERTRRETGMMEGRAPRASSQADHPRTLVRRRGAPPSIIPHQHVVSLSARFSEGRARFSKCRLIQGARCRDRFHAAWHGSARLRIHHIRTRDQADHLCPRHLACESFCILLCKHFLASRLANGRELAFAINANVVAGIVADRVGFTVLERFCKAVLYFSQISASRLWTVIGKVRNVRSDFGLGCFCVGLA